MEESKAQPQPEISMEVQAMVKKFRRVAGQQGTLKAEPGISMYSGFVPAGNDLAVPGGYYVIFQCDVTGARDGHHFGMELPSLFKIEQGAKKALRVLKERTAGLLAEQKAGKQGY